ICSPTRAQIPCKSRKIPLQSWDIAMMTNTASRAFRAVSRETPITTCSTSFRARLQYPELRRQIAGLETRHGAETILIEKAGSGMALLQDLHRDPPPGMARPIGQKPEGSKTDRMV